MKTKELLDQVLAILSLIRDDEAKLQKLLNFMESEIYEEPDDTISIPGKFQKAVHEIAEYLDCGLTCFFNPDTLELEYVPKNLDDPEEYELMTGESYEDSFKHESWNRCIVIEPPESRESFKIMERFIDEIDDRKLQNSLVDALNRRRPFANFKHIVETSEFRQAWFDFKQQQLEILVWDELQPQLEED